VLDLPAVAARASRRDGGADTEGAAQGRVYFLVPGGLQDVGGRRNLTGADRLHGAVDVRPPVAVLDVERRPREAGERERRVIDRRHGRAHDLLHLVGAEWCGEPARLRSVETRG